MEILLVTNNKNKVIEIESKIKNVKFISLSEINFFEEIEENKKTFKKNAKVKCDALKNIYDKAILADDSGLMVKKLHNRPNIYSKRYANTNSDKDNRLKVLYEMKDIKNRKAQFKTVLCLYYKNKYYYFTGILKGVITEYEKGENGFGYDSIFIPDGYDKTLAEMSLDEKNKISHRAQALKKLEVFLNENCNDR